VGNTQTQECHPQASVSTTEKENATTIPVVCNSSPKLNNNILEAYAELGQLLLVQEKEVVSTVEIDSAYKKFHDLYQYHKTRVSLPILEQLCTVDCTERFVNIYKTNQNFQERNLTYACEIKEMKRSEILWRKKIESLENTLFTYKQKLADSRIDLAKLTQMLEQSNAKVKDLQATLEKWSISRQAVVKTIV